MVMSRAALIVAVLGSALGSTTAFSTAEPRVPAGRDPGGVAVALVGLGADYTRPEIARKLARDGEGELIGWDLADNDNRPYPDGISDAYALTLAEVGIRARIVAVKIAPGSPEPMLSAIGFARRTPARIVLLSEAQPGRADWDRICKAAALTPQMLFVVPASASEIDHDQGLPSGAADAPANLIVVASAAQFWIDSGWGAKTVDVAVRVLPGTGPGEERGLRWVKGSFLASVYASAIGAAMLDKEPQLSGADLKARIVALAKPAEDALKRATRHGVIEAPHLLVGAP